MRDRRAVAAAGGAARSASTSPAPHVEAALAADPAGPDPAKRIGGSAIGVQDDDETCCRDRRRLRKDQQGAKLAFTGSPRGDLLFKPDATDVEKTRSHRHPSRPPATRKRWRC